MPGSRMDALELEEAASMLGIRIIAPDRPGYAHSTAVRQRKLSTWVEDIHSLTRHLGLRKYYIGGISGGGPHALACARFMPPEEVQGVAVIAGLAPPWISFVSTLGTIQSLRSVVALFPDTVAKVFDDRYGAPHRDLDNPQKAAESMKAFLEASYFGKNKEVVHSDEFRDFMSRTFREAFNQGPAGHAGDMKMILNRWGFGLGDIAHPGKVSFYVGTQDTDTPLAMSKEMSKVMKGARVIDYTDRDHWDILHYHSRDVLQDMLSTEKR